ncbi:MAG: serine/threonine protein kinase [Calditrichaeota bacterium]|nr:MAG: serine/threonine protein kinase [Calditrichota bacterium]
MEPELTIMKRKLQQIPFDQVDEFLLRQLIHEGQHTLLFLGCQKNLGREVVIKVLKPHINHHEEWIERFQREAGASANLHHPNIIQVYRLGEKDGYHFIASEYVDGLSLKELLAHTSPLPVDIAVSISLQLLEAMAFVHQHNILHRDIKPGNILINSYGTVKLTDFGLAQIGEEPQVTKQGTLIGTPAYMAPEQISGQHLDARADLYSFGVVFYELLSGIQPFSADNITATLYKVINETPESLLQLQPNVPNELIAFVEKCIHKDAEERWPDTSTALEQLHHISSNLGFQKDEKKLASFITPYLEKKRHHQECSELTTHIQNDEEPSPSPSPSPPHHPILKTFGLFLFSLIVLAALLFWLKPSGNSEHSSQKPYSPLISQNAVNPQKDSIKIQLDSSRTSLIKKDTLNIQSPVKHGSGDIEKNDSPVSSKTSQEREPIPPSTAPATEQEMNEAESIQKAQISVTITPWGNILINGKEVATHTSRFNQELSPGTYRITLSHPSFPPRQYTITLDKGEQKALSYSFWENMGFLNIEVRPWAEVYIDGKLWDTTPLKKPLFLSAGEHLLELKHPKLLPYREYVTIEKGDTLTMQIVLRTKN